jgi:potassium efflux system protein
MTYKFKSLRCSIASVTAAFRREMAVLLLLSAFFAAFDIRAQPNTLLSQVHPKLDETSKTASSGRNETIDEQLTTTQDRLVKAQAELAGIYSENQSRAEGPAGATKSEAEEYQTLLERLVQIYEMQLRTIDQIKLLSRAVGEIHQQSAAWTGFAEPPPYHVSLGDDLWREIRNKDQEIQALRMALLAFENELADGMEFLKPTSQALQQSAEQLEQAEAGADKARPRWLLELNQLRARVAEAEVARRENNRRVINLRIGAKEAERVFLAKKLSAADANIHFTQQDLDAQLEKLSQERTELLQLFKQAESDDQKAYKEHSLAQEQLNRLRQQALLSPDETSGLAAEIKRLEQSAGLLAARTETTTMRRRILQETRELNGRAQTVWKERFALFQSPGANALNTTLDQLETYREWSEELRNVMMSVQATLVQKLIGEQARQKDPVLDPAEREQSRILAEVYREQNDTWIPLQARLSQFVDLLGRAQEEAERGQRRLSLMEHLHSFANRLSAVAGQLADFEIYSVTDKITVEGEEITGTRRVTLGEMLLFLAIITVGLWLTAHVAQFTRRVVRRLFGLSGDSAALFARLAQILLVVAVVVAALTKMKIPVTVFAFLGGAMALAIGFGAQNLLNNFVSGLILLIERPVKMGDIVDVEGITGRITQIGARCCQIRRMDGIEMLVPNSAMIEKTVTNWTLSDMKRRASVTIGIAYGSSLEQTQAIIEAAVREHPDVLIHPAPLVLLEDFGESALIFTVYYWLDLAHAADRLLVASEIRVKLNRRLTEAAIVIAYPQRDVHLSTSRPFEVVIANAAGESSGGSNL